MAHNNKDFGEHLEEDLHRVFTSAQPIPVTEWHAGHITLDNDGTSIDMAIDGSTPKRFQYVVPDGKAFILSRVVWSCVDLDIDYLNWFGFGSALTNGCIMQAVEPNGTDIITEFLHPVKSTIEFAHLAGADLPIISLNRGVTPDIMVVRWSLFKAGYVPIFHEGQIIEFVIRDNLSEMDHFECVIQGRVFDH